MAAATAWGPSRFPISAAGPSGPVQTELTSVPTPSQAGASAVKAFSTDNPLLPLGVIVAATFGLIAFSTSVRLGHTTASLAVGNTK